MSEFGPSRIEYVYPLLEILDTIKSPKRPIGPGPHREDYATQEAFDSARGGPIALESN